MRLEYSEIYKRIELKKYVDKALNIAHTNLSLLLIQQSLKKKQILKQSEQLCLDYMI